MDYVLGQDVSWWNGNMDWQKAYNAGSRFAFIRAGSINSQGIPYEDFLFGENIETAPSIMPVGNYWYFRPEQDPITQADFFCDLIRDQDWSISPVVDIESNWKGLSSEKVADVLEICVETIADELSVYPIIYTRAGFWKSNVS